MYILGVSAFYHDSSAVLIRDGEILFAAQEERFSRIKGDKSLPSLNPNFPTFGTACHWSRVVAGD